MTFIRVMGILDRETHTVEWRNGELSGSEVVIERLRKLAEEYEGQLLGNPTWRPSFHHHLSDPVATFELIDRIFDEILCSEHDIPEPPPLPPGAIP